ncbi:NAD(P)/FAD-dependent oxidoreductase [Gordonia bronchialis]|uniref:NAD(P)/FAD-dependent oxidoreductase n=1 Tax=Gordonia bronchialis TaxID=2054 RepID=UPI002D1E38BE|nr:FAD-dependent monooxygenase [Gordonia bronchialis]
MCLRRAHLDDALVRTARAAGAEVREQCTATAVLFENGRATGIEYVDDEDRRHVVHAPVVVGADGRKSLVAQQVGVRAPRLAAPSGRACYFAYWKDDREALRHIASQWRVDGLLGTAFPCDNGDLLCLLQPPVDLIDQFRGRKVTDAYLGGIGKLPGLARRLAGCELVSRVRACTGIESYFRTSSGPGWALPGDAGHFKDPVTAQGIRDGYRYGRLLGEYLASVRMRATSTPTPSTATARWSAQREQDCIEMYQWTNVLAAGTAASPLEYELYLRARERPEYARVLSDIYNRVQSPTAMTPPSAIAGSLVRALRRGDTPIRDIAADLRVQGARLLADRRERTTFVNS